MNKVLYLEWNIAQVSKWMSSRLAWGFVQLHLKWETLSFEVLFSMRAHIFWKQISTKCIYNHTFYKYRKIVDSNTQVTNAIYTLPMKKWWEAGKKRFLCLSYLKDLNQILQREKYITIVKSSRKYMLPLNILISLKKSHDSECWGKEK